MAKKNNKGGGRSSAPSKPQRLKARPVKFSDPEFKELNRDAWTRVQEFKKAGVEFDRGPSNDSICRGLRRALHIRIIPVSSLKGLTGLNDVVGPNGKGGG